MLALPDYETQHHRFNFDTDEYRYLSRRDQCIVYFGPFSLSFTYASVWSEVPTLRRCKRLVWSSHIWFMGKASPKV